MKKVTHKAIITPVSVFVLGCFLLLAIGGNNAVTVLSENSPVTARKCVVIDAGHGGVDGGATSCTGVLESTINLEIALMLEDLFHLLGVDTYMIRTTDCSIYTQGDTIAAKKVSDLKERVRIVNNTKNAILLSIHQNHFSDSKYSGAQVFYAPTNGSGELAQQLQTLFVTTLNRGSNRKTKKSDGIYLMQNINCPGVLIECGFLSNPEEESKLRSHEYRLKLCVVIASACSTYLHHGA